MTNKAKNNWCARTMPDCQWAVKEIDTGRYLFFRRVKEMAISDKNDIQSIYLDKKYKVVKVRIVEVK